MSLWNHEQVAAALNTDIAFKFEASRVVIDSRKVKKGDVFVAIKGENFDGNEFASDAIKKGAVAAVISDEKYSADKTILTKDGIYALERLAYYRLKNSNARIIAITGSVGKTTVKEMLDAILSEYYKTHKTEGNLNNNIGLPLSISNMPEDTKFGIFEMGMNKPGEISDLSRIAHPDFGIITNIGTSHIEFFDSQEGIARAKAEIFEWLKVDGTAIIPADSDYFDLMEDIAANNGVTNILSFGTKINNPVKSDNGYISAHILIERHNIPEDKCREFNLNNILSVLTVIGEIGLDIDEAIEKIAELSPVEGRGNRFTNSSGATIINDAYNAGPESMKNALINLANDDKAKRKIALLGDMLELGEESEKYHKELAEFLKPLDIVLVSGQNMKSLKSSNVKHFDSLEALEKEIAPQLKQDDVVLIKGSNGSKMWKIVQNLQKTKK